MTRDEEAKANLLLEIADGVELKDGEFHADVDASPYGFLGLITFIGNVHQAEEMAETMRRIKAATRACDGIPTERLEDTPIKLIG